MLPTQSTGFSAENSGRPLLTGQRGEVWAVHRGRALMIVVGLGAAEGFTEDVAAEAVGLGLERAAAFAKGVRRAGGTVPVSLLV